MGLFDFLRVFREPEIKEVTASDLFKDDYHDRISASGIGCNVTEPIKDICNDRNAMNAWYKELPQYDENKDSILVIDDNPGIISFLLDDIKQMDRTIINLDDFNIITFDSNSAAYQFETTQHAYQGLNIKYAILDLTIGGTIQTKNGPSRYTGVDIYQQILIYNPEVKVLFYTGNNLNEYIRMNQEIIKKFSDLTGGKDIKDYVLFKTSLDQDNRRKFLEEWFTSK